MMDDDQNPPAEQVRPDPSSRPGLLQRLKAWLAGEREGLRASLEGVIEQHAAPNGAGAIGPEARSMMLNLLEFGDLRVDDVMVPRADIIAVEEGATVRELLTLFTEANHSRLPVYRETLDEPVGMVHIKDILRWLGERSRDAKAKGKRRATEGAELRRVGLSVPPADLDRPVRDTGIVRKLLFVPPSMPAADLLIKMQSTRMHLAIVVDEYGGTDGLVSIEDLVEEIVGDIADEHDEDTTMLIRPDENGSFLADARADIEDVEERLGIDLLPKEDEEDVDTLGGLMFAMLGRVPVRGELIRHPAGLEFEILDADARRVRKVRIHTRPRPARPRRPAPSPVE
jgi:CBS domain containing-hemolysin-like protein